MTRPGPAPRADRRGLRRHRISELDWARKLLDLLDARWLVLMRPRLDDGGSGRARRGQGQFLVRLTQPPPDGLRHLTTGVTSPLIGGCEGPIITAEVTVTCHDGTPTERLEAGHHPGTTTRLPRRGSEQAYPRTMAATRSPISRCATLLAGGCCAYCEPEGSSRRGGPCWPCT